MTDPQANLREAAATMARAVERNQRDASRGAANELDGALTVLKRALSSPTPTAADVERLNRLFTRIEKDWGPPGPKTAIWVSRILAALAQPRQQVDREAGDVEWLRELRMEPDYVPEATAHNARIDRILAMLGAG